MKTKNIVSIVVALIGAFAAVIVAVISLSGSKKDKIDNVIITKTIDSSKVFTNIRKSGNAVNMSNSNNNGVININQTSK